MSFYKSDEQFLIHIHGIVLFFYGEIMYEIGQDMKNDFNPKKTGLIW